MTRPPARALAVASVVVLAAGIMAAAARHGDDEAVRTDPVRPPATTTTASSAVTTSSMPATTAAATTTTASPAGSVPATLDGADEATGGTEPPPPPGGLAAASVGLAPVAHLDVPVAGTVRPGDGSMWIASRAGTVYVYTGAGLAGPVIDLSGETTATGERGLLGMAFAPDGVRLYVNFTDRDGHTHVDEFLVDPGGAVTGRRAVLFQPQPFPNHNGGHLLFGPDGFLYIGLGDGGGGGDPLGAGQDLGTLLGKVLRIDPRPSTDAPYQVPGDNPFVGVPGARPEIWLYGVRNPWRFSFDRAGGDLWLADVGQNRVEEIDWLPAGPGGAGRGANLGWNAYEGSSRYSGSAAPGAVGPVHEYGHDRGCSVTGGFVYRGAAIPALSGAYLYSDFCDGTIRALVLEDGVVVQERSLDVGAGSVASFAEDASGELYVLSFDGTVYQVVPA